MCATAPCGRQQLGEPAPGLELSPDGSYTCSVCYGVARRFPPVVRCGRTVDGEPCRFVKGHAGECKGPNGRRAERNPTRIGEFDVVKHKRRDPTFTPRRRVGPHR